MDLETLKLLLEVEAGENITYVMIAYFGNKVFTSLLIAGAVILGLKMIIKVIVDLCSTEDALQRWRDSLGIGCPGALVASERVAVIKKIDSLVYEQVAKKDKK